MRRLINNRITNVYNSVGRMMSSMSTQVPINVKQGTVVGEKDKLPNGETYYSFKGIPYAVPPIGKLRFEAPVPLEKFTTDNLDCSNERNVSLHRDPMSNELVGSEDSLFLNIYTPKLKSNKPLPVMVWIHGGAFLMGSGNCDFYQPLYLIQEDVIVVTLNYRLAMFGFLSLPSGNIPGNAGLKDQRQALKWINENIEQFNGDPNNVTLFGQSAGAAAIHLHLISDFTTKYFHKAILQSGSANMEWVIKNDAEDKARHLGELMGFKGSSDIELIEFLKDVKNPSEMLKHLLTVLTADERRRGLPISFKPVIEAPSKDAIVTHPPIKSLKTPDQIKMPVMMGYTSGEGLAMLVNAIRKLDDIDKDLARLIPKSINLDPSDKNCIDLANQIRKFYFTNAKVEKKTLNSLGDLMSDYHFGIGIHVAAELHAKYQHNSPLYFYRFSYVGGRNMFKKWFQLEKLRGSCHGDELFYLFKMAYLGEPFEVGSRDERMLKQMCKMWTNFAKFGNPTPPLPTDNETLPFKWDPVKNVKSSSDEFNLDYLEIDENTRMERNPDQDRMEFWRDIYRIWNKDFLKPKL